MDSMNNRKSLTFLHVPLNKQDEGMAYSAPQLRPLRQGGAKDASNGLKGGAEVTGVSTECWQ